LRNWREDGIAKVSEEMHNERNALVVHLLTMVAEKAGDTSKLVQDSTILWEAE
jgi:hypothetical protein